MLTNVKLRNIKCFDNLDLDLAGLNVLTGVNGSGKSTFIQSVLMVEQSANHSSLRLNGSLVEIGDYSDLLHEPAEEYCTSIEVIVDGSCYGWGYPQDVELSAIVSPELPVLFNEGESFSGFSDFLYVSAERWGPRNNVPLNLNSKNETWLGKHGEYTISLLGMLSENPVKLSKEDPRCHENQNDILILDNIIAWMGEISPNVSIDAQIVEHAMVAYTTFGFGKSRKYRATNVGFGLSYALSIVTALLVAKKGSLVIIENPEAHLHPKGQSKLGQLISLAANAGVQVLVETHSDHVVNAIRVHLKEERLKADDVNLFYFSRKESDKGVLSSVTTIEVDQAGEIMNWPDGFLDEWNINLGKLLA